VQPAHHGGPACESAHGAIVVELDLAHVGTRRADQPQQLGEAAVELGGDGAVARGAVARGAVARGAVARGAPRGVHPVVEAHDDGERNARSKFGVRRDYPWRGGEALLQAARGAAFPPYSAHPHPGAERRVGGAGLPPAGDVGRAPDPLSVGAGGGQEWRLGATRRGSRGERGTVREVGERPRAGPRRRPGRCSGHAPDGAHRRGHPGSSTPNAVAATARPKVTVYACAKPASAGGAPGPPLAAASTVARVATPNAWAT